MQFMMINLKLQKTLIYNVGDGDFFMSTHGSLWIKHSNLSVSRVADKSPCGNFYIASGTDHNTYDWSPNEKVLIPEKGIIMVRFITIPKQEYTEINNITTKDLFIDNFDRVSYCYNIENHVLEIMSIYCDGGVETRYISTQDDKLKQVSACLIFPYVINKAD